jgi:hypothetical protein
MCVQGIALNRVTIRERSGLSGWQTLHADNWAVHMEHASDPFMLPMLLGSAGGERRAS